MAARGAGNSSPRADQPRLTESGVREIGSAPTLQYRQTGLTSSYGNRSTGKRSSKRDLTRG